MESEADINDTDNVRVILFEDERYRLSSESLQSQTALDVINNRRWVSPLLRFESFDKGWLTLMNTSNRVAYKLSLKVEGDKLYVHCGCGNKTSTLATMLIMHSST